MAVVTPTDRPKSGHNNGVIDVFGAVFFFCVCVAMLLFGVFCGLKGFCDRTVSDKKKENIIHIYFNTILMSF